MVQWLKNWIEIPKVACLNPTPDRMLQSKTKLLLLYAVVFVLLSVLFRNIIGSVKLGLIAVSGIYQNVQSFYSSGQTFHPAVPVAPGAQTSTLYGSCT